MTTGSASEFEWVPVRVVLGGDTCDGQLSLGGGATGFIACDWPVVEGASLEILVMIDEETEAGLQLKGSVSSASAQSPDEAGGPGISVDWHEVLTSESPYSLKRFLRELGVQDVQIDATGEALYAYRHVFSDAHSDASNTSQVAGDVALSNAQNLIAAAARPAPTAAFGVLDSWGDEEPADVAIPVDATVVTSTLCEPELSVADADPWDADAPGSDATVVTAVLSESTVAAADEYEAVADADPWDADVPGSDATVVTAVLSESAVAAAMSAESGEAESESDRRVEADVESAPEADEREPVAAADPWDTDAPDPEATVVNVPDPEATVVTAVLSESAVAAAARKAPVDPWDEEEVTTSTTPTVISRVLSESDIRAAAEQREGEHLRQEATVVTRTLSASDLDAGPAAPVDPWDEVEASAEATVATHTIPGSMLEEEGLGAQGATIVTSTVPEPEPEPEPTPDGQSDDEIPMLFRRRFGRASGRRQVYDSSGSDEGPESQDSPPPLPTPVERPVEQRVERPAEISPEAGFGTAPDASVADQAEPAGGEEPAPPEAAPEMPSWIQGVHPEQRERERVSVSVPVTFLVGSTPSGGRVLNISRAGCLVETSGTLPVLDTRLNIRLPVMRHGKHHIVMLTTKVVRHVPGAGGFAVKHTQIDELGEKGLFVQFLLSHKG